MRTIVRRGRAALSLAALWGAAGGAVGLLVGLWVAARSSRYPVLPDFGQWWFEWHDLVVGFAVSWAAAGALTALGFATLLWRAERGRNAEALSPARLTLWGGLAGGGLFTTWWLVLTRLRSPGRVPVGFPLLSLLIAVAFGAGCAWLTLWLSRRSGVDSRSAGLADASRAPQGTLQSGDLPPLRERADTRAEVT
jgi:hypothetical protein